MQYILFLTMAIIWGVMAYRLYQQRSFYRIFGLLMSSFLLYISFELVLWSLQLPLVVMMGIGFMPVFLVAYGFRVYDYNRQREKLKNDRKHKIQSEA